MCQEQGGKGEGKIETVFCSLLSTKQGVRISFSLSLALYYI